ncbi:MAG TPA: hypothetical protein VK447_12870 [Myxococcaceae bacterium]|nr:hypothetical protein [Myxococcaceae bacterium]
MKERFETPDLTRRAFARTNPQTVAQRVALLRELVPGARSIAELCCGDCSVQWEAYRRELGVERYRGLDLEPEIVQANRARGIDCVQGNVLDPAVLRPFLDSDVIFFGPPLSEDCDGHRLLSFREVRPGFDAFARLLLGALGYGGLLVCIGPRGTTAGDARYLYEQIKTVRPDFGLRLMHHSHATVTGGGEVTEPRLKYVELWFSNELGDLWEIRQGGPTG